MKQKFAVIVFAVLLFGLVVVGQASATNTWSAASNWGISNYLNVTDWYNHTPGGAMWHWARMDSMLTAGLDMSGATFTPDTTSIGHANKILEWGINSKLARADSTADSTANRVKYMNQVLLYGLDAKFSRADSSADSTANRVLYNARMLIYGVDKKLYAVDSTLAAIEDSVSVLARLVQTLSNDAKAIALYDSTTASYALSKLFAQAQDTIKSPTKTIVMTLRGTNPPSADYRIREFTISTVGDTVSVVIAGVGFVTSAVKVYPGEGVTPFSSILADSVVVSRPCLDTNVADVRWWARGR